MDTQLEIESGNLSTETGKLQFLLTDDNTTAAIILIEKACEQYQNLYNQTDVPYSYIDFFCQEFNKYSGLFTNKLKDFYDNFTIYGVTNADLIDRYVKSFYAQHEGVRVEKEEAYLCFKEPIVLSFTKEMQNITNQQVSTMVENIINICHKIDTQDELVNLIDLYESYMMDKFIDNYDFKFKAPKQEPADLPAEPEQNTTSDAVTLVGDPLENKYQSHGRVTRVVIPKLNLPSSYPINLEESRLTAGKSAKKFCSPAQQIVFINRKKILTVKYSNKFLEKRTKEKKKKKFDWDF